MRSQRAVFQPVVRKSLYIIPQHLCGLHRMDRQARRLAILSFLRLAICTVPHESLGQAPRRRGLAVRSAVLWIFALVLLFCLYTDQTHRQVRGQIV